MAQMIVRNIPPAVMRGLRTMARLQGTSVEAVVRDLLAETVDRRRRWAEFFDWAEDFRARTGAHGGPTAETLIREDRER